MTRDRQIIDGLLARIKQLEQKEIVTPAKIRKAEDKAIELVLALTFTALLDKFGADLNTMQEIWQQTNKLAEEVSEGRINVKELAKTLRTEYQIDITGGFD